MPRRRRGAKAVAVDADEERVDRALGDLGEAVIADAGGDLVSVGRLLGEESQDDALQGAFEHLGHLLAHESLVPSYPVLSVAGYRYKVTPSTGT